ncbi:MAG: hypothetical protein CMH83_05385 [Nocardioides sp.]|nr:hypothetical protein [Nocardioides sp.]
MNADDDDDEWDPDDDWEPEEPWDDDARVRGIVKFFDPEQRFGFIVPADGGADVFFHASDVAGPPLTTADRVRFEAVQGFGSTKAKNVERIDTSTVADPWAGGVTSVGWDGDEPPF